MKAFSDGLGFLRKLWDHTKKRFCNPFYVATAFFVLFLGAWLFVAPSLCPPEDIATLNRLACEVAGIGCASQEEADNSLLSRERRLSEELSLLREGGDGQTALARLENLRSVRQAIREAEENLPWKSLVSLGLGVFLCLMVAGLGTMWIYQRVRKVFPGKLVAKRESTASEIKKKCTETEIQKPDVLKVLKDAGQDEWKKDFVDFVNSCSRRTSRDRISWPNASKMFFGIAEVCQEKARDTSDPDVRQKLKELECKLRDRYKLIRKLLLVDAVTNAASKILPAGMFFLSSGGLLWVSSSRLHGDLAFDWHSSALWLALAWLAAVALYYFLQFSVRSLTERTRTQADDVLVIAISFPISAGFGAYLCFRALDSLPPHFEYGIGKVWRLLTTEPFALALTTIVGTFVLVLVFNRVIIYLLQRWAASTEQTYDDMAVRMLQIFGTFIILAIVGALLIMKFQTAITAATGVENILLPYAIVVSVVTALLGYATKEGVENFFGGLLLQIDKPFNLGDRLILESGEICDVRNVGMRSTRLYNVLQNSEISIPNRIMVSQKITNISRPDVQLRIPITVQLGYNNFAPEKVDAVLLDIAYSDPEIEHARVSKKEVSQEQRDMGRFSLEEHWENLVTECPRVKEVKVERILGRGKCEEVYVGDMMKRGLSDVIKLRQNLGKVLDDEINAVNEAARKAGLNIENLSHIREVISNAAMQATSKDARTKVTDALVKSWLEADTHEDSLTEKALVKLIGHLVSLVAEQGTDSQLRKFAEHAKTGEYTNDELYQLLRACGEWYRRLRHKRYSILIDIAHRFGEISQAIYSIRDALFDVKPSTDEIVGELLKEPVVHSEFRVTDEGLIYLEVSFHVFSSHLERKFEVVHKVHKAISHRFRQEGIPLGVARGKM